MATPNKFSNPDMPCCACPMAYLECFVTGPIFSVLCFPCVCVRAWDRERQKGRVPAPQGNERDDGAGGNKAGKKEGGGDDENGGGDNKAEKTNGGGGGVVRDAPTAEPPMSDNDAGPPLSDNAAGPPVFDAAKPRDQWPAEVRNRDAIRGETDGQGEK